METGTVPWRRGIQLETGEVEVVRPMGSRVDEWRAFWVGVTQAGASICFAIAQRLTRRLYEDKSKANTQG